MGRLVTVILYRYWLAMILYYTKEQVKGARESGGSQPSGSAPAFI